MATVKTALKYLARGWSVIPVHIVIRGRCTCGREDCPTPGKHPRIKWTEYSTRLPTSIEVSAWFDDEFYGSNIGLVTGRVSNVVVVDLDVSHGIEIRRAALGLPRLTLTSRTGGGGTHLFYRVNGEQVPSRIRAFPDIDIKAERAFVVLPPSKHVSGSRYRWKLKAPLATIDLSLIMPKGPVLAHENGWHTELLDGVDEGIRNITAARLTGRYCNAGLSLKEVWMFMVVWNERNRPPLSLNELKTTVKFVYRKHQEENWELSNLAKELRNREEE